MTIDTISGEVKRIREKYDESDPVRLAKAMGILLLYEPMGDQPNACKGFYLCQSRTQVITVNSSLSRELQRIILCHELGHAALHRKASGVREFHDFQLFDETSVYEYEANIFAADFLMEDDQVLSLLNDDISFFGAAAALGVPPELLDFKFRVLKRKGYKVIDPPIRSRGDFLKKIHLFGDDKS
jgi:Zn-dependent peptidase ImmA (M78 family)